MPVLEALPTVNACLNGLSAVCLARGYWCIRNQRPDSHRRWMLAAVAASTLFLASYLTYHGFVGSVGFTGTGWVRPVYFTILISHSILAAVVVPLVLVTLYRAWRQRLDRHRRIARWTLPLWAYVSVTGVVVYLLLYHW